MSVELILTRHAKSDWDDPAATDHLRPLNARGRTAATAMGSWLREQGWQPDEAMVSDAERTAETWLRMAATWPDAPQANFLRKFYLASPDILLAGLHRATGQRLMLIAHNPGIAMLAELLCETPPAHARFMDYPTGATLVLRFNVAHWPHVQPGTGRVCNFVIPADLSL